ncbi:hypothetical protein ONE63_004130 [Megalurothrips usitatus]|uniref:Down syndrome cell adhesion molecule-like protein Dscam2 n=1 Tax=Megalurothrips usitatus TaxID=439358 RepID=A0AAV7X4D9_9NEOP|nr:hypothetical protein ONE63_004130 [Megalurothrips usitatus]
MLPTGELVVLNANQADAFVSYQCRVTHRLTGEARVSARPARLTVNEPRAATAPQLPERQVSLDARRDEVVVIPCVALGQPPPEYRSVTHTLLARAVPPRGGGGGGGGSNTFRVRMCDDGGRSPAALVGSLGKGWREVVRGRGQGEGVKGGGAPLGISAAGPPGRAPPIHLHSDILNCAHTPPPRGDILHLSRRMYRAATACHGLPGVHRGRIAVGLSRH